MFPNIIEFVDTGTRRYPVVGEYYCWINRQTNEMLGPMICDDEDEIMWSGKEEDYAIYRRVE